MREEAVLEAKEVLFRTGRSPAFVSRCLGLRGKSRAKLPGLVVGSGSKKLPGPGRLQNPLQGGLKKVTPSRSDPCRRRTAPWLDSSLKGADPAGPQKTRPAVGAVGGKGAGPRPGAQWEALPEQALRPDHGPPGEDRLFPAKAPLLVNSLVLVLKPLWFCESLCGIRNPALSGCSSFCGLHYPCTNVFPDPTRSRAPVGQLSEHRRARPYLHSSHA